MSELLRAILTQESIFSSPRYYYVESSIIPAPVVGQQIKLVVNIEGGTTFLQTAQFVTGAFANIGDGAAGSPVIASNAYSYQWTASRSYKDFMQNPNTPAVLAPGNYNRELYSYPLWRDNEVIVITVTVLVPQVNAIYFFLVGGIEYQAG